MKKLIIFISLMILLFNCSKKDMVYSFPQPRVQFIFLDTNGTDYLANHGIKPTDIKLFSYSNQWRDSIAIPFAMDNINSFNKINFECYHAMKIFIGDKVVDTITAILKKYYILDDEKYYHHQALSNGAPVIKSLYYNGYLLSPAEIDKKGDSVIHRVVVEEDF